MIGTAKTKKKFDTSLLKDELDLISSFEDRELTLILTDSIPGGPPAASFKKGPNEYGIYLSSNSKLIADSGENGVSVARALLQHECAHTWLTNFGATEEMVKNLSEKHNMPIEFVKQIENIVEDCRIESVWTTVFPGSMRSFIPLYNITIEGIKSKHESEFNAAQQNPIGFEEALLIARFGIAGGNVIALESKLPAKVKPYYDKFAEELEKVKNTDWKGTYVVTDNILSLFNETLEREKLQFKPDVTQYNGVLAGSRSSNAEDEQGTKGNGSDQSQGQPKEGISPGKGKDSEQDASNKEKSDEGSGSASGTKSAEEAEGSNSGNGAQADSCGMESKGSAGGSPGNGAASISKAIEEKIKLLSQLVPTLGEIMGDKTGSKSNNELNKDLTGSEEEILNNSRGEILNLLKNMPLSKYPIIHNLDRTINRTSDQSSSKEVFEITGHGKNGVGAITVYDGPVEQYNERIRPNPKIKKMLEEIELLNNPRRDLTGGTSGIRPDIRKLIRYEVTKDPAYISKPYLRHIKDAGAEIWMLLDISGSMGGQKINAAKRILGSIHDSLDGSKYVHLRMFGFYGSDGTHVFEFDRKMLMNLAAMGDTPTDIAIYYAMDLMKKDKSNFDKTLFIITDGDPNNGQETKNALNSLKNAMKNVNVFTIFISREAERAVEIFSPSDWYFNVSSMDEVEKVLEKGIKGIVDNIKKQLENRLRR